MPQVSEREFERLPLLAHQFLAGVPLHDVWAVDLPSPRAGITLDEFLRAANERLFTPTPVVQGLLDLRLLIGRLFGWDSPRPSTQAVPTFADRLTDADWARSLTPAGVREGPNGLFRVVYRFENEKLVPGDDCWLKSHPNVHLLSWAISSGLTHWQRFMTAGVIPRPHRPRDFSGRFINGQVGCLSF